MPAPSRSNSRKRSSYVEIVAAITGCQRGQERNSYPYIRDLFIGMLGYRPGDLLVDTADDAGGVPDLCILVPSGIPDCPPVRWVVVEVKDEPGIFHRKKSRARVFQEKAKYINLDTAWFMMIDPKCLVLRPVTSRSARYDPDNDIVLEWAGLSEDQFRDRLFQIHVDQSASNPRLEAFRSGDEAQIAEVKLSNPPDAEMGLKEYELSEARAEFYLALRSAANLLKLSSHRALDTLAIRANEIRQLRDAFAEEFGIIEFHIDPFRLVSRELSSREAVHRHKRAVAELRRAVRDDPAAARLGCFTLPEYQERAKGDTEAEKASKAVALLASETASLLIARCLMLRFFEDHGFFGEKRYLCNGGVAAFQTWRKHYKSSYAWFLRESYGAAAHLAAAFFEEGNLDWVLTCADPHLSDAIERALFYLSRFDFSTVKQDVLSGVYGQFLDNTQRKEYGEHYTPPEVAGFIVRHLDLKPDDKVLDPSCGLGTFLIEAWKMLVGESADRGAATWDDIQKTLANVRGNDLNSFSATIAQLQLLWHLFAYREQLQKQGFPEPVVTGGHDSLHAPQQLTELFEGGEMGEFDLIDTHGYDAVAGNPPYVRPARQTVALDPLAVSYFDEEFSARSNLCNLFLYKAMDYWLRPNGGPERPPGRLGFVIPLSVCDNDDSAPLRKLFLPDAGRWTVREIVDLELISPQLFGADVVCMILLAERRPATSSDIVRLRVADERCALFTQGAEVHVQFNLDEAPVVELPYSDLFSPDGRWLTRLTPERKRILDRFEGRTFGDIALKYWVGKNKKQRIVKWALEQPSEPDDLRWQQESMVRMGAAFRGKKFHVAEGGLPVFKGENISACEVGGEPNETDIDVLQMDDISVWRYANILPSKGYAFHRIAPALYCAPFAPEKVVFLNTASLFFPGAQFAAFPFDLLVLSRVYQFVWAIAHREAVLFRARANVYVTTVNRLPWTDKLLEFAENFNHLRERFLEACKQLHQAEQVLRVRLAAFGSTTLRSSIKRDVDLRVEWSPAIQGGEMCEVGDPIVIENDGRWIVQPGDNVEKWAAFNVRGLADSFVEGLRLRPGDNLRHGQLLDLPIPAPEHLDEWRGIAAEVTAETGALAVEEILDAVDACVAEAYSIPNEELEVIWREFETDPMLRRVQPNLPYAKRRRLGLRAGLTTSDRFTRAYKTRSQSW